MSRSSDPVAIVAPAVDLARVKRDLIKQHAELQDAERRETATADAAAKARADADGRRLSVGRLLCEARKAFPRSGPKASGWGALLRDLGIEERSAQRWMALAGYVEREIPDTDPSVSGTSLQRSKAPTTREVAKARAAERPAPRVTRDEVDEEPDDDVPDLEDEEPETAPPSQHVTIHAQTVQMVAAGPVAVVPAALPATPGAKVVAITGPRMRRVTQLLQEAAREWEAMLDELRPLVEKGQIPKQAIEPLLRLPDATRLRDQARQIAGGTPAGECRWCGGTDSACNGCKGRFWLDGDRLALADGDAKAAAARSAS